MELNFLDIPFAINKDELNEIYEIPIHPYSGRLISYEDYLSVCKAISKKEDKHNYEKVKKGIDSISDKPDECKEFDDWIQLYTAGTYMIYHKYFIIPPCVTYKCSQYRVSLYKALYRGVHFGLINLEYLKSFIDGYEDYKKGIPNRSIKPISTTTDIDEASIFMDKDILGIVGSYKDIKYTDVLIDLNLVRGKEHEKEVILLPTINPHIFYLESMSHAIKIFKNTYEFLSKFKCIFNKTIEYKEGQFYLYKDVLCNMDNETSGIFNFTYFGYGKDKLRFRIDINNFSVIYINGYPKLNMDLGNNSYMLNGNKNTISLTFKTGEILLLFLFENRESLFSIEGGKVTIKNTSNIEYITKNYNSNDIRDMKV